MLGTIVNVLAVVIGSVLGILFKSGMKEKYREILMTALGLAVLFVGLSGALDGLLEADAVPMLYIVSLVVGSLLGTWIDIERRLESLGDFIEQKMKGSESNISQGFVTASLIYCVGTMAILGSIESGISSDHTTLYIKSMLDGVMSIILASSMGIGVMISSLSVLIYQGSITLFASVLQPFITVDMMREIGIVGGVLIFCLGLNILEFKKIKVGNMLPAIVVPVIYYLPWIQNLFNS
ncbi:MAG: DUF554 domain-containing protein [Lachnospiraceae bacterium]